MIDEADLILSYGHSSEDIRSILSGPWNLPKVYQSFLMSATLTGEVEELKGVVLRNPVSSGYQSRRYTYTRSADISLPIDRVEAGGRRRRARKLEPIQCSVRSNPLRNEVSPI